MPSSCGTPSTSVASLPWSHIVLTGDYLWNKIDQPLGRFRSIQANRFNPKSFVFPQRQDCREDLDTQYGIDAYKSLP